MGERRSKTGAHISGSVMESDGDSKRDHHSKPVESRISPERLQRFREVHLSNGCNAVRAAIAIGMKPTTAKANAHRLASAVKLEIQEALYAVGVDAVAVAKKLKELLEAKKPMWNPRKRKWDFFPDNAVRLKALQEVFRLLNLYPAPKPGVEPARLTVIDSTKLRRLA
jgi:hypothetical protein